MIETETVWRVIGKIADGRRTTVFSKAENEESARSDARVRAGLVSIESAELRTYTRDPDVAQVPITDHDRQYGELLAKNLALTADVEKFARMLEKATVRIEILVGRMRACEEHKRSRSHDLSILESSGWIEEQRDLVALTGSRGLGSHGLGDRRAEKEGV